MPALPRRLSIAGARERQGQAANRPSETIGDCGEPTGRRTRKLSTSGETNPKFPGNPEVGIVIGRSSPSATENGAWSSRLAPSDSIYQNYE